MKVLRSKMSPRLSKIVVDLLVLDQDLQEENNIYYNILMLKNKIPLKFQDQVIPPLINSEISFYQEEQEELLEFPDNSKSLMMTILKQLNSKNSKKPLKILE